MLVARQPPVSTLMVSLWGLMPVFCFSFFFFFQLLFVFGQITWHVGDLRSQTRD